MLINIVNAIGETLLGIALLLAIYKVFVSLPSILKFIFTVFLIAVGLAFPPFGIGMLIVWLINNRKN
jgi:hypothetical protein